MELIEELTSSVNIIDVMEDAGIQLRKAGMSEYSARCPFHEERTPSFFVNPDKGVYHCFGCGAKGNVITFVREYYGKSFNEAVEYLIENYAPHLLEAYQKRSNINPVRQLARRLYKMYIQQMKYPEPVLEYLQKRRITWKTIKEIGILPYVRKDFTRLELKLQEGLRININQLSEYAVLFPVRNENGNLVGFVARNLDESGKYKKYINSKGFQKQYNPFFADQLYRTVKHGNRTAIVVEGIFDALRLYQAGYTNVVAVLGAEFPYQYFVSYRDKLDKVILLFDKDEAGMKATRKAFGQLLSLGIRAYIYPASSYFNKKDIGDLTEDEAKKVIESVQDFNALLKQAYVQAKNKGIEQLNKVKKIIHEIASHIYSQDVREAFLNQFGLKMEEPKKKKTSVLNSEQARLLRTLQYVIFETLRDMGHDEALQYEPENKDINEVSTSLRNYLKTEVKRYYERHYGYSLIECLKKHNFYKLIKNPALLNEIFFKVSRRQSLIVSKDPC